MGITLGKKTLKDGRVSLYLDYNFGRKRHKEYLHIVLELPQTPEAKGRNRQKLELANQIRTHREISRTAERYHLKLPGGNAEESVDFYLLFEQFLTEYKGKDRATVKALRQHLHDFAGGDELPVGRMTHAFCQEFYEYLALTLHGTTPTNYFKKFKVCLETCVERDLLPKNPAARVKFVTAEEISKDILSLEEIALLARTPCRSNEVKRAFLFACNTGLRWCDIAALTYRSVDLPNRMLHFTQAKVKRHSRKAMLHLTLNATALSLLQMSHGEADERIFALPSYSYMLRVLKAWVKSSGISKHITFHCGRHSFITNIMMNGANIKTASELAGHSTIRHTEKYVHVVDELKRKAVDSLPDLSIEF